MASALVRHARAMFGYVRHPKRRAFLEAFIRTGTIFGAALAVGVSRNIHPYWMEHDPEFERGFREAQAASNEVLLQEARRRATHPKRPSDLLLIFLLKGAYPHIYRERYEHSGPGGAPLPGGAAYNINGPVQINIAALTCEETETYRGLLAAVTERVVTPGAV